MPPGEHIHIISAGENIHIAYPEIFRTIPAITHTYIIANSEINGISPNAETTKQWQTVRNAVNAVKEISASLSIPFSRETVFPPTYPSVRTILITIHRKHPGARFTFDLSCGSKELCLALLALAPWLGEEVYAAFDEKTQRSVPQLDRSVKTLMANPNYQTILALLLRSHGTGKSADDVTRQWVSREYLFKQLWSSYHPSRMKKVKTGEPVNAVHTKKAGNPAAELTHGTLSTLMHSIEKAGLVIERVSEDTRR